jgi:hypothetical protein
MGKVAAEIEADKIMQNVLSIYFYSLELLGGH